jgi:hypothetical protein
MLMNVDELFIFSSSNVKSDSRKLLTYVDLDAPPEVSSKLTFET